MGLFGPSEKQVHEIAGKAASDAAAKAVEERSLESPTVPLSDGQATTQFFNGLFQPSASGSHVTTHTALGVPAFWSAVNFIAGTLAKLPVGVFDETEEGKTRVTDGIATMLSRYPGGRWTSYSWRKYLFYQVLTHGRSITLIQRDGNQNIMRLVPLDTTCVTVSTIAGQMRYHYAEKDGGKPIGTYLPEDVIDITFLLDDDRVEHYSPVGMCRNAIGLALDIERYGAGFFQNGGVPPLSLQGPFQSPGAVKRAADDVWQAIKTAMRGNRNVLTMPLGHELKAIGFDPDKGQMVDARRFQIEEIARIYSLPPVFLQDLTHGTFSNTEQQDLHFVKHTLTDWIRQFEEEVSLKLFAADSPDRVVRMNVDGLLRGDFTTRMTGYATAVQNAVKTPDECRDLEDLPRMGGEAALLHVQGATVPLGQQADNGEGQEND